MLFIQDKSREIVKKLEKLFIPQIKKNSLTEICLKEMSVEMLCLGKYNLCEYH